ncbi:uncharacterized protein [Rutidosis leptorrhynchoides]|uniref:uncharacterized protein n=1 Tax=Rutidosis leptorrhynchoides TaxID=125765 RepID=UPI003A9A2D4A
MKVVVCLIIKETFFKFLLDDFLWWRVTGTGSQAYCIKIIRKFGRITLKCFMLIISLSNESIRRNFFWGGTGESAKLVWVKWEESLLPYDEGGLNIGSLRGKNLALLGKWFWRAKTKPNALWVSIIKSIYGTNGLLPPLNLNGSKGVSSVWSNILRAGYMIEQVDIKFASSFARLIGNGEETDFWNDLWLCEIPLKQKFKRLHRLELEPDCKVRDRVIWSEQGMILYWNWRHAPNGRTLSNLDSLLILLHTYIKHDKAVDTWVWNMATNGCFTTKKLSSIIDDRILGNRFNNIGETLRNNLVPAKVSIFIWRVLKRWIPVRTELDKRGIDLDSVRCPLCDDDVETIDHSLTFCRHAMDLWDRIYKWWGLGMSWCNRLYEVLLLGSTDVTSVMM